MEDSLEMDGLKAEIKEPALHNPNLKLKVRTNQLSSQGSSLVFDAVPFTPSQLTHGSGVSGAAMKLKIAIQSDPMSPSSPESPTPPQTQQQDGVLQSPQHTSDSSSAGSDDISIPATNRVSAASNNTTTNGSVAEPGTRNQTSYSSGSQHGQYHHYHPNQHHHQHHHHQQQQHMQMLQPGLSPQGSMQFYMMYPQPHYYGNGDPNSPMGPPSPLMGSPVGTPTAMMFPQTPFAQHTNFQGYGGGGEVPMSPAHVYNAQQSYGYFHPLFNNFPAFVPQPYGSSPPGGNNGNGGKKGLQRSGGSLKMGGASGSSPNLNYPFHHPSHYMLSSQKSGGSMSHFFGPGMQDGYKNATGNPRLPRTASTSISRAISATKSEADGLAALAAAQASTDGSNALRDSPTPSEARQPRHSEASPPPLQQQQLTRLSLPGMASPSPPLPLMGGALDQVLDPVTLGQIAASVAPPMSIAAAAATAALTASPGAGSASPNHPPVLDVYDPLLVQQQESVAWPPSPLELSHNIQQQQQQQQQQHSDLLTQGMYQQQQAAMLQQQHQMMMTMPYMYDQQAMMVGAGGDLLAQMPYLAPWQGQEQQQLPAGPQLYNSMTSSRTPQLYVPSGSARVSGDSKGDPKRLPSNRAYTSPQQQPPVPSYQQQQRALQEQYQAQQMAHQQAQMQQAQQHVINSMLAQLGVVPGVATQAQLFHLQQQLQQQYNMLGGGAYPGIDQNMAWAVSLSNGGQISSEAAPMSPNYPSFPGGGQQGHMFASGVGPAYPPTNTPRASGGISQSQYSDLGFPSHLPPVRYSRTGGAGSPQSPNSPAQRYSPVRGAGGNGSLLSPAMRRGLLAPRSPAPGSPDSGNATPSAPRLNARQRRTQRRAQEREVKGEGSGAATDGSENGDAAEEAKRGDADKVDIVIFPTAEQAIAVDR